MLHPNFAAYIGTETEEDGGFIGFTAENGFFAVLGVEEGLSKEKGKEFLKKVSSDLKHEEIKNLGSFEDYLLSKFKEANIPTNSSFACCLLKGNKSFLKTTGQARIYIKREINFARLIDKDNSASGFITPQDLLIFTVDKFVELVGGEKKLVEFVGNNKPTDIRELIAPELKSHDDAGTIALFVTFEKVAEEDEGEIGLQMESPVVVPQSQGLNNLLNTVRNYDRKKTLTFIAVFAIVLVLLWSVVLGYQRRVNATLDKKIQVTRELITENLNQAEDVAFLNLGRAQALINDARENVKELKKEAKGKRQKEIVELENFIKERESKIFKKEEKKFSEFFDLSVEEKDAQGIKLFLDKDNLVILDPKNRIYLLSLSKKSLDKKNFSEIKGAQLVGLTGDIILFFKDDGMSQIKEDKVKKVIDKDDDWGNIVDFSLYNSNIYVLDSSKNKIYKYLVAEDGYSDKSDYLKDKANFGGANSIAIDSDVYVGLEDRVLKFTGGVAENFNTAFPEENVKIKKIFTAKEIEKVYAWDKDKGVIYIIGKTGSYERQIDSPILSKADDFVVLDTDAYIISGSKIYKMSLN